MVVRVPSSFQTIYGDTSVVACEGVREQRHWAKLGAFHPFFNKSQVFICFSYFYGRF